MGCVCPKTIDLPGTRWVTWHHWLRRLLVTGAIGVSVLAGTHPALADHSLAYIVRPGDTATEIAQQYGIPLSGLARTNPGIDLNVLSIGETITVRPPDVQSSNLVPPASAPDAHYPSFDISPEGIIQRSLAWIPALPPILPAPYHSQFDGTIWASGNCGPTTLAMVLGALGVNADQLTLRSFANEQMGSDDPANGTSWESLAYAARQFGAVTEGLNDGTTYRQWTLDDLKRELGQDRPVMLLVRFWDLPDHAQSTFAGDHYIVALGFDPAGDLVYHDSATLGNGSYRTISPAQLLKAWSDPADGEIRAAMAFYR